MWVGCVRKQGDKHLLSSCHRFYAGVLGVFIGTVGQRTKGKIEHDFNFHYSLKSLKL
jgi:hypothetical protein